MRFRCSRKTLPRSQKTRQARRCITRATGAGWSSPVTRVWSCLLSAVRPGFIPRGTLGRRRQIHKGLKSSCARCEARPDPIVPLISFARLHWRNADEPWSSSRIALMEKSWRRRAERADLAMIRCSASRPSRKHLRSFLPKKKISAAIVGKPSGDCSRLSRPCYSFCSYGHEIEEKTIDEETICPGKIESREIREDNQGCQDGARCGGKPQARSRNSRETGGSVRECDVRAKARECISTADLHDSFGAVHGRARESGCRNALQEISGSEGIRVCYAGRVGTGHPADRIFQEQDQIGDGSKQGDPRKVWRASAAHNGRDTHAAGGRAKNGQRRARHSVRNRQRSCRGYSRAASLKPLGFVAK